LYTVVPWPHRRQVATTKFDSAYIGRTPADSQI